MYTALDCVVPNLEEIGLDKSKWSYCGTSEIAVSNYRAVAPSWFQTVLQLMPIVTLKLDDFSI